VDGKGVIINARSESLASKGTFSGLLREGRCVVPAGGYYEWKRAGGERQKHYIKDAEGNILFMAGLYREGERGREYVVITKAAYGEAAAVHNRMPVILRADRIEQWLDGTLSPDDIARMDFNTTVTPCGAWNEQLALQ
jgi:putative SOS response-associated peptidase YedK